MKYLPVIFAAIFAFAACAKPKDLEFVDIQNIRMVNLGLTESELGMDVRFFNPNNQRVNLKDAEAKLYVNTTYIGDTRMDTLIPVPRNDTFSVPLILHVKSMAAVSKIMQSLSDSTVDIKVEGTVKMGKGGLFRSFPIQYNKVQNVNELMNQVHSSY
jgi:LEA14-like dessication related protein